MGEDLRPFGCPQCHKTYKRKDHLKTHIASIHDGVKPHCCPKCDRQFAQRSHLKKHVATVHDKLRPHSCSICTKTFSEKTKLSAHMASVHEGHKPHPCATCGKGFSLKCNLTKHIARVHNATKDFRCTRCSSSFFSKWDLSVHESAVHDGMRQYPCAHCERSFGHKNHLQHHVSRIHSGATTAAEKSTYLRAAGTPSHSSVHLDPHQSGVFTSLIPLTKLSHSTSPESWNKIRAESYVKAHTPSDQSYDSFSVEAASGEPVATKQNDLKLAYFMAHSEDVNDFPFSIYPKGLTAGSSIKIALIDPNFLRDSKWSLFYVGSTPSGMPSKFKNVFQTHVTAMRTQSKDYESAIRLGWTLLRKQENNLIRFCQGGEVTVCSKVVVSGETFNTSVMLSFVGGLDFSQIEGLNLLVIDGWKYRFSEGRILCPLPGCTTELSSIPNFKGHYRGVHLKLKSHCCEFCDQTFSLKHNLRKHVSEVHDRVKPFACHLCRKCFARSAHLASHLSSKHKGKSTKV